MPDGDQGTGGAPAFDWSQQGLDADTLGYVQTKQFKAPADVVTSYRNLEKLQGVPAEQLLRLPKDDTPEAWKPIWARLGAGETPDAYKLPVAEGDKGEFAKQAAAWFHELGVPVKTAARLAEKWNAHVAESSKQQTTEYQTKLDAEAQALKAKWGAAADQNTALAKKAAMTFGLDSATIDKLETVMGYGKVMELFHTIGSKLGEASFEVGDGKTNFSHAMTPEQAKSEIENLKKDAEFIKKWSAGDAASRARLEKLHEWASA